MDLNAQRCFICQIFNIIYFSMLRIVYLLRQKMVKKPHVFVKGYIYIFTDIYL